MKITFAFVFLVLIACSQTGNKEAKEMPGAYLMVSQGFKNERKDTTNVFVYQLKIYTDKFMMYGGINPSDSVSSWGLASYTVKGDTVTERAIYQAAGDMRDSTPVVYKLAMQKTQKGYRQVIPDVGGREHYRMSEEYESVGSDSKSPLDGLWKMAKAYYTDGNDTSYVHKTQYKVYYAGHVIWGCTYDDSVNKNITAMGYGKFELKGNNNEIKEDVTRSSYFGVSGRDFEIGIDLIGKDQFIQTFSFRNGDKMIEMYERVKK